MFESGVLDFFVLLGPGPKEVSRQYGVLTGIFKLLCWIHNRYLYNLGAGGGGFWNFVKGYIF